LTGLSELDCLASNSQVANRQETFDPTDERSAGNHQVAEAGQRIPAVSATAGPSYGGPNRGAQRCSPSARAVCLASFRAQ